MGCAGAPHQPFHIVGPGLLRGWVNADSRLEGYGRNVAWNGTALFCSAYFSQEIFTAFPRLIYPVILAGVGYLIFVAYIFRTLAKSQRTSAEL